MNRPEKWYNLPYPIRETLADNCDLDYDCYEGSHPDSLHSLLCDPEYCCDNNKIVQSRYNGISDEELTRMCLDQIDLLQSQIDDINKLKSGFRIPIDVK